MRDRQHLAAGQSRYATLTLRLNARRPDTTARRSKAFPVSPLFGGALPQKVEVYVKNDCGAALAASGQVGQYRTETFG